MTLTPGRLPLAVESTASSSKDRTMDATVLQLRLRDAGFDPGPLDGRLGLRTRAALIAFQRANGLAPDGVLGVGTLARLVELRGSTTLDAVAERKLAAVHLDLRRVVYRALALADVPFTITEGRRSLSKQRRLLASGASRTLRSRHLSGHAVDLAATVDGQIRWDWPLYDQLAKAMKRAGADLGVPVEWGGDWRTFRDGPHFQLPWERYPEHRPPAGPLNSAKTRN